MTIILSALGIITAPMGSAFANSNSGSDSASYMLYDGGMMDTDGTFYHIAYEYGVPQITVLQLAQLDTDTNAQTNNGLSLDDVGGLDADFGDMQIGSEEVGERKKTKGDAIHKWLGISTLVFTALIPLTAPKEKVDPDDPNADKYNRESGGYAPDSYHTHEHISQIATYLAVATVTSGLINYWGDDFDLSKGVFYRKNIHAYLGILGTLLMAYSLAGAPDPDHVQVGVAGGVMMGVAYGLTFTF